MCLPAYRPLQLIFGLEGSREARQWERAVVALAQALAAVFGRLTEKR